ncbi:hypothetical protein IF2G_11063 [Cordyceps javanica]|nr:hypothetical protein IF2G_11063 [Cordyceps javanica]
MSGRVATGLSRPDEVTLDGMKIRTPENFHSPLPRRTKRKSRKFILPKAGQRNNALRVFEPFSTLHVQMSAMSEGDLLGCLMTSWSSMLQCIEPGNFQKFVIEKVLAAGQVLYMVGRMTLDAVKTGLSRVLAGYPYHGEADRWENNIGAALAYQTEISHCRLEIDRCIHWYYGRLQRAHLPDERTRLDLPEFELLRPAMLIYLLLGGAQSPVSYEFVDIAKLIEHEPLSNPQYQFLPFFGEHPEELGRQHQNAIRASRAPDCDGTDVDCWSLPNTLQKAYVCARYIAAWTGAMQLFIPHYEQPTEYIIPLPNNRQWETSSIQVALVIPYSTTSLRVKLGDKDSESIDWPPSCALLLVGRALWLMEQRKEDKICAILWIAEDCSLPT